MLLSCMSVVLTWTASAATSRVSEVLPTSSLTGSTYSWSMVRTMPVAVKPLKPGALTVML